MQSVFRLNALKMLPQEGAHVCARLRPVLTMRGQRRHGRAMVGEGLHMSVEIAIGMSRAA